MLYSQPCPARKLMVMLIFAQAFYRLQLVTFPSLCFFFLRLVFICSTAIVECSVLEPVALSSGAQAVPLLTALLL